MRKTCFIVLVLCLLPVFVSVAIAQDELVFVKPDRVFLRGESDRRSLPSLGVQAFVLEGSRYSYQMGGVEVAFLLRTSFRPEFVRVFGQREDGPQEFLMGVLPQFRGRNGTRWVETESEAREELIPLGTIKSPGEYQFKVVMPLPNEERIVFSFNVEVTPFSFWENGSCVTENGNVAIRWRVVTPFRDIPFQDPAYVSFKDIGEWGPDDWEEHEVLLSDAYGGFTAELTLTPEEYAALTGRSTALQLSTLLMDVEPSAERYIFYRPAEELRSCNPFLW